MAIEIEMMKDKRGELRACAGQVSPSSPGSESLSHAPSHRRHELLNECILVGEMIDNPEMA
jgi:hypothetical protein